MRMSGMRKSGIRVGIDIGATKTRVQVEDVLGEVIADSRYPTESPRDMCNSLAELVRPLLLPNASIGCAFPGSIDGGMVNVWPSRPDWIGTHLVANIAAATGCEKIYIADDGYCAAFGEHIVTKGRTVVLMALVFGTGIGSGLIVGGTSVQPTAGSALSLGHLRVSDAPACSCGRKGCLQAVVIGDWCASGVSGKSLGQPMWVNTLTDVLRVWGVTDLVLSGGRIATEPGFESWLMSRLAPEMSENEIRCVVASDPAATVVRGAIALSRSKEALDVAEEGLT